MLKRFLAVMLVAFTMTVFTNTSEAAKRNVEEVYEVLIQEIKREENGNELYVLTYVKMNDVTYFKTEKVLSSKNISEHFVRYADSSTGVVKKAYHWREIDNEYVESPNDKPARITTFKM